MIYLNFLNIAVWVTFYIMILTHYITDELDFFPHWLVQSFLWGALMLVICNAYWASQRLH